MYSHKLKCLKWCILNFSILWSEYFFSIFLSIQKTTWNSLSLMLKRCFKLYQIEKEMIHCYYQLIYTLNYKIQMDDKYKIETQNTRKIQKKGQQQTREALQLISRLKSRRQKYKQQDKANKLNEKNGGYSINPQEYIFQSILNINVFPNKTEENMLQIWQLLIIRSNNQKQIVSQIVKSWQDNYIKLKQQNTELAKQIIKLNFDNSQLLSKLFQQEQNIKDIQQNKQLQECYPTQQQKCLSKMQASNLYQESQSNLLEEVDQTISFIRKKDKQLTDMKQLQITISQLQSKIEQLQKQNSNKVKQILLKQKQIELLMAAIQNKIYTQPYQFKTPSETQQISFGSNQQQFWMVRQNSRNQEDLNHKQKQKLSFQQKIFELEETNKVLQDQLLKQRNNNNQLKIQNISIMKMMKQQAKFIEQLTKKHSIYQHQVFKINQRLKEEIQKNEYNLYKINYLEKQQLIAKQQMNNRIKNSYEQSSITNSIIIRRYSMDKPHKLISKESSTLDSLIS